MQRLVIFLLSALWLGQLSAQEFILFKHARVFDGEQMHSDWHVLVHGDSIFYAGAELPEVTAASEFDLQGKCLMPGMIEGHSHLLLHPYNETSWNDQVLKESFTERTVRAVNHARETLLAGFTTVRDLGTEGADYIDVGLREAIAGGLTPGPDMLVAGRAIVATGSYGPKGFAPHVGLPLGAEEADGNDLIRVVRDQIGHDVDLIKVYADYRWGPDGEARPTFSVEELSTMVKTAAASGRPVVAHAATAEGMRRAVLAGVQTIEHGDGGTPEVFALMRDHGVALCPTLAAGDAIMQYRGWQKGVEPDPARITAKKISFKQALDAGVTICAGGDVGVFAHGDNTRELIMMEAYGMSPLQVLQSATSVNARVFGLTDRGRIATGAKADLIVLDGDPIQDLNVLRHILLVMKNGQIYRDEVDQ